MIKNKFDARVEIEKILEKNKIFFTKRGDLDHIKLISVGLGNILYDKLLKFIEEKKENGFYILEIKNPNTEQKYNLEIRYDGGKKPKKTTMSLKEKGKILYFREQQIERFWEEQPFFYDKSKIFYLWNCELKKWEISDEIDFLNSIRGSLGIDTINSKSRVELIEGFKQIGRKHHPKTPEKSWLQFKDKIYDGKTGEFLFESNPDYFFKNPIPFSVGKEEKTPNIDKLFEDWVGKEEKIRLYELFAYTMTPDRFMQRIFALCGGGSNGKGTCMKLLEKFIGGNNICTSELKLLSEIQFETSILFGKLACIMGEVSRGDLRHTNVLKKLAGEDKMRFCFKGKDPFDYDNSAICICLTNELPTTPDRTVGFYRKWNIIDFPNQFQNIKENLLSKIPEKEFENLAFKSLKILKKLYNNPKFTNEGDFEERIKRYEDRSNPIVRFIESFCEENTDNYISLKKFTDSINNYLKFNHLRLINNKEIKKTLKDNGYYISRTFKKNIRDEYIHNLKIIQNIPIIQKISSQNSRIILSRKKLDNEDNLDNASKKEATKYYKALSNLNFCIRKSGEDQQISLKSGEKYEKMDFGDNFEQVIKILLEGGSIKKI